MKKDKQTLFKPTLGIRGTLLRPSIGIICFYTVASVAALIVLGLICLIAFFIFDTLRKLFTWVGALLIIFVMFCLLARKICESIVFAGSSTLIRRHIQT